MKHNKATYKFKTTNSFYRLPLIVVILPSDYRTFFQQTFSSSVYPRLPRYEAQTIWKARYRVLKERITLVR